MIDGIRIPPRDHHLPPDPDAYRASRGSRGRVIVIAPTRAACETIELALGSDRETVLSRDHGETLEKWSRAGTPFGIVAGTGTGKTLGIRLIAEAWLGESLVYGVVNREREATPETPSWNVVVVTTGIARRWLQDALITGRDTLIVDEIHQTSAELELCLALGKRAGCRFVWLSATVDPAFYSRYLGSREVLLTSAFDPERRARVDVVPQQPDEFLDDRTIRRFIRERRGVAVFVPTRAEVERLASDLQARWPRLHSAFYHGGQPIRIIRPFLTGEVERPYLLAMTAAGQSALNIPDLDTVVIYDARYGNVVERGRNVLHRLYLGANEILQMAGRVHGRVEGGIVTILSDRDLDFDSLRPTPPEFQLAGDAERVAMTCAAIGVDATDLDLPVPLDRTAYRNAVTRLTERGIVSEGRLTEYGHAVEAMPVERPWAELLVQARGEILPVVAVVANVDSLHRMTRDDRDLTGVVVKGSDHLTTYNLYAEALNRHGRVGEVYGLPRHLFSEEMEAWAEERGVLVKAIEDIALGVASVYRSLEMPLPPTMAYVSRDHRESWAELLAQVMPLDLAIDERLADGTEARVGKTSVAGSWGPVAGTVRFFADRFGHARASIDGTTLEYARIRRHAVRSEAILEVMGPRSHQQLGIRRTITYHGFELENVEEPVRGALSPEQRASLPDVLARALVDGETAHPDQGAIRRALKDLRDLHARSGGTLSEAAPEALVERIRSQLHGVTGWPHFLKTRISFDSGQIVPEDLREELKALPSAIRLRGDMVPLVYRFHSGEPVVVLHLREGQVRQLTLAEIPPLDRPLRFAVSRSHAPDLEADTLPALRDLLSRERGKGERIRSGKGRRTDRRPPRRRR